MILSISINKETHKLSISKIMLNYGFNGQSLSCTAYDEGYFVMIDHNCTKLVYVAETFQIIRSIAAYPIDNIEYDESRNTISNSFPLLSPKQSLETKLDNINFIHQIPFSGDSVSLLQSPHCIIRPDISSLFATKATIFNIAALSIINEALSTLLNSDYPIAANHEIISFKIWICICS